MNETLSQITPDAWYALCVYLGALARAARGERVPVLSGILTSLGPAFVTCLVLVLLDYLIRQYGYQPPVRVIAALGGLLGFVSNRVVATIEIQGRRLEDGSAVEFLISVLSKLKPKP